VGRLPSHPLDLLLVLDSRSLLLLGLLCLHRFIVANRAYHTLRVWICLWYTALETHSTNRKGKNTVKSITRYSQEWR
jgi:hypothetical protein